MKKDRLRPVNKLLFYHLFLSKRYICNLHSIFSFTLVAQYSIVPHRVTDRLITIKL